MLTVVDDLQEMDFGEFEGKSVAELEDNEDFGRWLADSAHNAPPGGETGLQMAERLMKALSEIFAHMMQNRITSAAVVTHGGVIMTLLTAFGYPKRELGSWKCGKRQGLYHSDVAADVDAGTTASRSMILCRPCWKKGTTVGIPAAGPWIWRIWKTWRTRNKIPPPQGKRRINCGFCCPYFPEKHKRGSSMTGKGDFCV